jgi:hypothetical protein
MENNFKMITKRQVLFVGANIGVYLIVNHLFGFFVGFIVNTAIFLAILLYIRKRQLNALGSFESSDKTVVAGTRYSSNQEMKLRYGCISCSSEVKGSECTNCGSKMKKPLF